MGGVTNPAEPFFKDGVWGWNDTDWIKAGVFLNYYEQYVEDLGCVGLIGAIVKGQRNLVTPPVAI